MSVDCPIQVSTSGKQFVDGKICIIKSLEKKDFDNMEV